MTGVQSGLGVCSETLLCMFVACVHGHDMCACTACVQHHLLSNPWSVLCMSMLPYGAPSLQRLFC